ncbi:hypothetical protein JZM24_13935 [Candidatus Sodalis endolongispinus]|uniref:Phage protein n=1 Tax=Candidatus Sodalis endolongispinus TaxID=2812662 RepID=A0ABS5YD89_9GAMM|nr:hypothetical protein [Candidatus Sodalis endolongispinus]MBT9432953.1 hypothetical protein [Candidatus Sodalis endolongispinus]
MISDTVSRKHYGGNKRCGRKRQRPSQDIAMKKLSALVGDNAQKGNVAPEMNSQEWMDAINRELSAIVKNTGVTVEDDNE